MKVIAKQNRELILINAQNTQNENIVETLEIEVPEKFEDFNKKIVFITDDGIVWDIIQNNEYKLQKAITKYKKVDFYIWLTKDEEDWRSKTKRIVFYDNQDASGEITPEEIDGVNTVVNILEDEIDKVDRLNITAEKIGKVTTLTITDKEGEERTYQILDGNDGADGQDGDDYVITEEDYQAIADIVIHTLSIPTKTSDLINDSDFVADNNYVHTDNNFTDEDKSQIQTNKDDIVEINQTIDTINTDIGEINQDISDINQNIDNLEEDLTNYSLITETGSQIELNINSSDFKLKAILKDKNGNTIYTSNIIDLPLETMVVGASYDNVTKEVVLTLQNGTTVRFSVADLVSGLVSSTELETILGNYYTETEIDALLTDYVKNTDYATNQKGGVVKIDSYAITKNTNGNLMSNIYSYETYNNASNNSFVSKGTLENVIAGKELVNKTYVDNIVGDIANVLDVINGEVV